MTAADRAYKNARKFRRDLSLPEKLLWVRLRGANIRFRRQHPIGPYVVDFYCPAANLAIEVDGESHNRGNQPQRDAVRTEWLKENGIDVLRIPARDVLVDPDALADALLVHCEGRSKPLHQPAAGPPPHRFATGRSE